MIFTIMILHDLGNMVFRAVKHFRNKNYRSCRLMFCKKICLKNFAKFTEKISGGVSFLMKSPTIKIRLWRRCFPVSSVKPLRTYFSVNASCGASEITFRVRSNSFVSLTNICKQRLARVRKLY